ncbi:hypothetical protein BH20ACT23_BH20ACT23_31040 [soil metagenome]
MASSIEQSVADVLASRAARIQVHPTGVGRVLRRASRRRRLKVVLAIGAVVPVVFAGVALVGVIRAEPTSLDVSSGGQGGRTSTTPPAEPLGFARPVVSGAFGDTPWWLFDSDNSPNCPALGLGDRFRLGSMGPSCSNTIRARDLHFSRAVVGLPELSDFRPVYGVVGRDIDGVQVDTGSQTLEATMYRATDESGLRYFLVFLDSAAERGRVQGLNAGGAVVRSLPLCVPMVEKDRMQVCSEVTKR